MRPFDTALQWANAINEEWWLQGDMEARLGLPIGGMNKRPEEEAEEGAVAGTQIGFGQFVVGPMLETLGPSPADPQPSARLATPPRPPVSHRVLLFRVRSEGDGRPRRADEELHSGSGSQFGEIR